MANAKKRYRRNRKEYGYTGFAIKAELNSGQEIDGPTRYHRLRYHIAKGFVDPLDRVLDLGCGTGYGTSILADVSGDVQGFDMDEENIKYANERFGYISPWFIVINFQVANIEKLRIPEAEVAVSFEVIEHLYEPKVFIDKLKSKIKKYIIVSVPLGQKLIWNEEDKEYQEVGDSTHHSVFAVPDDLKNLFLDDNWKEYHSFVDGVTLISIFYNKNGITDN